MNKKEINNREKLRLNKPEVYNKIIKINDNNPLPIIQNQYKYICNFKCSHCSIDTIKNQNCNKNKRELTPKDIENISKQAHELGLARWEINGGEPFTFKEYDQIVEAINPNLFYINSVTNGWHLDLKRAKHLKKIGVDRIQVGIDSLNEDEHDIFRHCSGAHKRALQAIDNCLEVGLDVFTTTVVTKQRLYSDEFKNFIEHFNNKGVSVFMSYAKPVGAWENRFDLMINEDDLKYVESLEKQYSLFSHLTASYGCQGGCLAFKGLFAINPFGDVMPCQYLFISLGNIFEESLKDILERGKKLKPFKTNICPIAMDKNFIEKYITKKMNNKILPVNYKDVFNEEDFI